jgi:flagellar protein FlaG
MAIDIRSVAAAAVDDRRGAAVAVGGRASGPAPAGNSLPHGGQASPPAPALQVADLSRAVAALNQFLSDSQRSFRFQVDDSTGETIVRIVNPETGDLVRQIPSEDVLAAAHALRVSGNLVNARA